MTKKKIGLVGTVIMTFLLTTTAFASQATGGNGHYSAGFSKSGGYSYASTYVSQDAQANQQVGIHLNGSNTKVKSATKVGNGSQNISYAGTNTYGAYYVSGSYPTFHGSLY